MLQDSPSEATVQESIEFLRNFTVREDKLGLQSDSEELILYNAVVRKTIFNIYALAVDLYLEESSAAQLDAEWWADIEQSTWSVASYLLQCAFIFIMHCVLHMFLISLVSLGLEI
jgi:nuclear-control-of-ATPase protein 2